MQQTRNGSSFFCAQGIFIPHAHVSALLEHPCKNSKSLSSSGTGPCYLSLPGTYPGCRTRKTMPSCADDMRSVLGRRKSYLDTCRIVIVCRSPVCRSPCYPSSLMVSWSIGLVPVSMLPPWGVTPLLCSPLGGWLGRVLAGNTMLWPSGSYLPA